MALCWFAFQCAVTVGATVLALDKRPISASSYENKSQVGKIVLAIPAFRSEVLDLCLSPIRSEGRRASLHSIIRLAGVPPCERALMR